jgi:purine-binding chemotaxis protein CheW
MAVSLKARDPREVESAQIAILVFRLGSRRFGLPVARVDRVEPACEINPLPDAPAVVLGVISVRGALTPVLDLRRRFGEGSEDIALDQRFVLTRSATRNLAVLADAVEDIHQVARDAIVKMAHLFPGTGRLNGLAAVPDGLIYIHDPEGWLAEHDEAQLDAALRRGEG